MMNTKMSLAREMRLPSTVLLVSATLAGLLIMHGFEGANISLTSEDGTSSPHENEAVILGAFGVCVFVLSIAGLGVAAAGAGRKHRRFFAAAPAAAVPGQRSPWSPPAGRSLLLGLSVLRL